jgi:hypothetical protein
VSALHEHREWLDDVAFWHLCQSGYSKPERDALIRLAAEVQHEFRSPTEALAWVQHTAPFLAVLAQTRGRRALREEMESE